MDGLRPLLALIHRVNESAGDAQLQERHPGDRNWLISAVYATYFLPPRQAASEPRHDLTLPYNVHRIPVNPRVSAALTGR